MASIGGSVRDYRKRFGWTQAQLAQRVGVSRETITRIENGRPPDYETLVKLASAFGLPSQQLSSGKLDRDGTADFSLLAEALLGDDAGIQRALRGLANCPREEDAASFTTAYLNILIERKRWNDVYAVARYAQLRHGAVSNFRAYVVSARDHVLLTVCQPIAAIPSSTWDSGKGE